jgi:hypothetical protein
MDIDQARDFLRENHRAVLATRRRAGGVQLSPVTAALDGGGRAVISATETRRIAGEHPDWERYRRAMELERRVLIRVSIDRAGPG